MSSIDSAMLAWNAAGEAVAVPNGAGIPGGGRNAGAAGAWAIGAGADCMPNPAGELTGAAAGGTIGAAGRGADAITSGAGAGAAATLVGASSSSASATDTSIRVSPTTIWSPDWSLALLTFWPLTKVPFVEPRSMMLMSPGPVTSMTACIRLTLSSSSRRCDDDSLPTLITGRLSRSSRRNWSPL